MTVSTTSDGLGGMFVHAGPSRLGHVFPARTTGFPLFVAVPGRWFGRRAGGKARVFDTCDQAIEYVTGEQAVLR